MNGKSKVWASALLVGVLLLGALAGVAVDRTLLSRSATQTTEGRRGGDRDRRTSYMDWLSAELDLNADQRTQIETLVAQHRDQVSGFWGEMRPRLEELQAQLRAEISDVLTDEQRTEYEALMEKHSERHRRSRNGEENNQR
jgi:Spy/CpxP family protein refolding chaperone